MLGAPAVVLAAYLMETSFQVSPHTTAEPPRRVRALFAGRGLGRLLRDDPVALVPRHDVVHAPVLVAGDDEEVRRIRPNLLVLLERQLDRLAAAGLAAL